MMPLVSSSGQNLHFLEVQIFSGLMVEVEATVWLLWGWVLILDFTRWSRRFFGLLCPRIKVFSWMQDSLWSISSILRLSSRIFLMGGF
jgi:hypothetical protein